MELKKENLNEILTINGRLFNIPLFQRGYKWSEEHWEDLFNDIIKIYFNSKEHFMGSIVFQKSNENDNHFILIDGQQRLATISLLLLSFAKWLKINEPNNIYLYENSIRNFLITNNPTNGDKIIRLIMSSKESNKNSYDNLINSFYNNSLESFINDVDNSGLKNVVDYFEKKFNELKDENDFNSSKIFETISTKLRFITITLDKHEDGNIIFETLNSRGESLESGDLIRNYILMNPEIKNRVDIYNKYWLPLEDYFEHNKTNKINMSEFFRFFLYANSNNNQTISQRFIYSEIKNYINDYLKDKNRNIINLLEKINLYRKYFELINNFETYSNSIKSFLNNIFKNDNKKIKEIIIYFSIIKYSDLYVYLPIMLKLLEFYHEKNLSYETFIKSIKMISSYAIRLSFNDKKFPNKTIPSIINIIETSDDNFILKEIQNIINQQRASIFLSNDEFLKLLKEKPLYSSKREKILNYLLFIAIKIDTKDNIAYSNTKGLSLEHIFPQNSNNWIETISNEDLEENKKLLHTIGNLTLITQTLNSSLSNKKFIEKKCELEKYSIWPFERENYFSHNINIWDKSIILERAEKIAKILIENILPDFTLNQQNIDNPEFNISVNNISITGNNQKEKLINAVKKISELFNDSVKWRDIKIKGFANSDLKSFTEHQKNNVETINDLYINTHTNLTQKKINLNKLSTETKIHISFDKHE